MALEQTGLEFVTAGAEEFQSVIDDASESVSGFESVGQSAADGFNVVNEIITGALREIGAAAIETLAEAGKAVLDFAQDSFDGALDAEKGLVRLRGAIKRAGDAAPVSEQQALEYADALKHLAGGSDDAVIAAEAMLLKFKDIGKDVFPQALQTSLDLAAVLGTDATSAAEQLGRALGNPEQASRILRQAGVYLTDQEKEQIKVWGDAGDAASAQAFILDKLSKATTGAAQDMANTAGGQIEIFKETIVDAGEQIASAFLPILQVLMDSYLKPLLPIIGQVADLIASQIQPAFSEFGGSLEGVNEVLKPIIDSISELFSVIQDQSPEVQAISQDLFSFLNDELGITLPTLIDNVASIIRSLTKIWREHGDEIMSIISFTFKLITATILGTLTVASGIIDVALQTISGSFDFWTAIFQGRWEDAWNILLDTVESIADTIMVTIGTFIQQATSTVTEGMSNAFNDWFMAFTAPLQDAIIAAGRVILDGFGGFYEAGVHLMDGLRHGIWAGIGWITDAIAGTIQQAISNAQSMLWIHSPSRYTEEKLGEPIGLGAAQGVINTVGAMESAFQALVQPVMSPGQYPSTSVGNSYNSQQSWNLNVNSQQASQGIISDFGIMQAMASGR